MLFRPEALESCGFSMEKLAAEGVDPAEAMQRFETWLQEVVPAGQHPIFVGFNAPFDWMFVNDYFHRFLGHNPFGHAAIDIKSYYMGLAKVPWEETTMQFLGPRYLNQPTLIHHALRDALDQGEIFRKLLLEATGQQDGSVLMIPFVPLPMKGTFHEQIQIACRQFEEHHRIRPTPGCGNG